MDRAEVSDSQNCGNILAGVGPWAIENGLVPVAGPTTPVRIHMVNTGSLAVAHVRTPQGAVEYEGEARIDGVPGTAAPIALEFLDVAGSSCGSLLPTGTVTDTFEGIELTCIDNGMPVIIVRAADLGVTRRRVAGAARSQCGAGGESGAPSGLSLGPRMNLGDVARKTVPKVCLVSAPRHGGSIATATFIPHRVHEAIGVLGAVSVATACVIPGSVAAQVAQRKDDAAPRIEVEHPSGFFTVDVEVERGEPRRRAPCDAAAHRAQAHARRCVRARRDLEPRMTALSVCLLGFGEVGQALSQDLRPASAACAPGTSSFRMPASAPSRAAARLEVLAASDAKHAVADADLVISAVTAAQIGEAARSVAPHLKRDAYFFDLNSTSPAAKTEAASAVDSAGGRFVEAAIMSPIAPRRAASPMLLGGAHAAGFLPLAHELGFSGAEVFSGKLGAASAAKMCRSVVVKGLEALMLESLLTARQHGVDGAVLESLQSLFPADSGAPTPALHDLARADPRTAARRGDARSGAHGRRGGPFVHA